MDHAAKQVDCLMHKYRAPHRSFSAPHSQYGEEFLLLPTLLRAAALGNSRSPGLFVELGALDGETLSNTLLLERCFGFRGVLIEANPTNFAKLIAARRNATRLHSAVCAGGGTVTMSASGGATSTILETTSEHHLSTWKINRQYNVTVPCRPLSAIMAES